MFLCYPAWNPSVQFRKINGIMRKVEPLPMPVVMNSNINIPRKPWKFPPTPACGMKFNTPNTAEGKNRPVRKANRERHCAGGQCAGGMGSVNSVHVLSASDNCRAGRVSPLPMVTKSQISKTSPAMVMRPNSNRQCMACWNHGWFWALK